MTEYLNSIEDFLGLDDRPIEDFEVPEWNKTVKLRGMMGNDRDAWEAHVTNGGKEGSTNLVGMRAKMVAACLVDSNGDRVFPATKEGLLGQRSAAALERLFIRCMALNGMSEEDEKKLVENFTNTPDEPSTSD